MDVNQPKYAVSTYGGRFFDFKHPERYDYDIEEIAHALSNVCRYGGHSRWFYSVAEHSVLVSRVVPPELALCGLLHDASEAFVGDMPSPLKALCASYKTIENRVQRAIADRFVLPYPFPAAIHLADKQVYKAEREQITSVDDNVWHTDILAADVEIEGWSPDHAFGMFLLRYKELKKDNNEVLEEVFQAKAA